MPKTAPRLRKTFGPPATAGGSDLRAAVLECADLSALYLPPGKKENGDESPHSKNCTSVEEDGPPATAGGSECAQ